MKPINEELQELYEAPRAKTLQEFTNWMEKLITVQKRMKQTPEQERILQECERRNNQLKTL